MRVVRTVVLAVALLAGCAGTPAEQPAASEAATEPESEVGGTLSGTLGGDSALEGGCAWLDTARGRVEVIYPEGYEVLFDPLRLEGPEGVVAEEGDRVTLRGSDHDSHSSICQVGRLFTATDVVASP